jgi:hypothetical protein
MPVFSLFIFVALTSSTAQGLQILPNTQQIPSLSSSPPSTQIASTPAKLIAVKITSPVQSQEVPIGKNLTVSGVTATANNKDNNATTLHCKVFVIANDLKPYQLAKATGKEGVADYSKWSYVLTSNKNTTIKQGQYNKITAKYTCNNNPKETSFFSVNITGKADSPISNTTNATSKQHQQNITKTFNGANTTRQKTPDTANINSAIGNNSTSTVASISKSSSYDSLVYLDNSKSTGEVDKAKSVAHDTPFILPFP